MDGGAGSRELTVLGDPTRARIVKLIRDSDDGRALVGRLADALGLRQPTVSHHMKALADEGIVIRQPEGRRVWYSLDPRQADRVDALLGDDTTPDAEPDLARIVDDLAERYRGTFSRETVDRYVAESHELLSANHPPPLLASRTAAFATTSLDALARSEATAADDPRGAVRVRAERRTFAARRGDPPAARRGPGAGAHRRLRAGGRGARAASSPRSTRSACRSAASSRSRSPTKRSAPPTSS